MSSSLGVQCALQINPLGVNKVEIIKIILRKLNMPMERKKEKYLIVSFLFNQLVSQWFEVLKKVLKICLHLPWMILILHVHVGYFVNKDMKMCIIFKLVFISFKIYLWPHHTPCGTLVSDQGPNPRHLLWKCRVLTLDGQGSLPEVLILIPSNILIFL